MSFEAAFVYCGGSAPTHPLVQEKVDGVRTSTGCLICKLHEGQNGLRMIIESARDLLVEGKAVQAHRALEHALSSQQPSAPKTGETP